MFRNRATILSVLFLAYVPLISGYSLLTNNTQRTTINNYLLTQSKFIEAQKQQQDETEIYNKTEQMRIDTERALILLATQIHDKLAALENKVSRNMNCSNSRLIEDKYNLLLQSYTQLQHELNAVKVKSVELNREIQSLNVLKVQSLHDVHALQQQMHAISLQTNALTDKEQDRTKDLLALHNATVSSERTIAELKKSQFQITTSINNYIGKLETAQNQTTLKIYNHIKSMINVQNATFENKIQKLVQYIQTIQSTSNSTLTVMQQHIAKNDQRVAATVCKSKDFCVLTVNQTVTFDSVRTQVGISDIHSFISSGKFTCEFEGLYIISASLMSNSANADFAVVKNGYIVARSYISSRSDSYHSSTAVVAVELHPNDNVWIQIVYLSNIAEGFQLENCFTIIKIK